MLTMMRPFRVLSRKFQSQGFFFYVGDPPLRILVRDDGFHEERLPHVDIPQLILIRASRHRVLGQPGPASFDGTPLLPTTGSSLPESGKFPQAGSRGPGAKFPFRFFLFLTGHQDRFRGVASSSQGSSPSLVMSPPSGSSLTLQKTSPSEETRKALCEVFGFFLTQDQREDSPTGSTANLLVAGIANYDFLTGKSSSLPSRP